MTFGNKLYNLRKSRGMSQEALASELNTSRQAISKWENDKGFPETETILMISNFFGVTVDHLLKDGDSVAGEEKEHGYYASKEFIQGFLMYERSVIKLIARGVFLLLISGTPYLILPKNPIVYTAIVFIMVLGGIGSILAACFKENEYEIIEEEPLCFDNNHLKELRNQYNQLKKKYLVLLITGIGVIFLSISIVYLIEDVYKLGLTGYHTVALILFASSVYMLIYSISMMSVYDIVTNNKEHIQERNAHKKFVSQISLWHVLAIIILSIVVLCVIYTITNGEGHISRWIEKFISKL